MRPIQLRSERDFNTVLTSVIDDAQMASFHWQLYKDLGAAPRRYAREMNQAPAFWSLTIGAHRETALFRLVRLYEPHGGLGLPSLLDTIKENLDLFDEGPFRARLKDNPFVDSLAKSVRRPSSARLAHDRRSVSEADPLASKLLALRNRVLAHRDPRVVLGLTASPAANLADRRLLALLKRAGRIVNRYSILFVAGSHLMRIAGQDDYLRVLTAVRERRIARERQVREEIATAMRRESAGRRTTR